MKDQDTRLDRLLRQWRCPLEKDLGLEAAVWQRIAEREEGLSAGWGARTALFRNPWAGPAMAASFLMAAVLGGIGAAELRVRNIHEFSSVQNQEQAYFESIDPVALARHEHH